MTRKLLFSLVLSFSFLGSAQAAGGNETYAQLLKKVVRMDGVRWDLFGAEEKRLLADAMNHLASASLAGLTSPDDQLAFWINAHNACVMKLVSDHLPADDVMKISGLRDRLTCKIIGTDRTIVDIQSGVIRPMFNEPRVHFALWWGTKGGAKLADTPYEGKTLKKTLGERTKQGLSDSRFVDLSAGQEEVSVSPIFDWFKVDFGPEDASVLTFIKKNADKEVAGKLPKKMANVKFASFDWSLDKSTK